jgi:hypothetical protein
MTSLVLVPGAVTIVPGEQVLQGKQAVALGAEL